MAKKNEELEENKINEEEVNETSEELNNEEKVTEDTQINSIKSTGTPKLVANTTFCDKYNNTIYPKGTEFIVTDVEKTTKTIDGFYMISEARAEELKASSYVDEKEP